MNEHLDDLIEFATDKSISVTCATLEYDKIKYHVELFHEYKNSEDKHLEVMRRLEIVYKVTKEDKTRWK